MSVLNFETSRLNSLLSIMFFFSINSFSLFLKSNSKVKKSFFKFIFNLSISFIIELPTLDLFIINCISIYAILSFANTNNGLIKNINKKKTLYIFNIRKLFLNQI